MERINILADGREVQKEDLPHYISENYHTAVNDEVPSEAVTENGLIPPFTSMPGIGEQAALSIVEERKNGRFLSAEEMIIRCPKASKAVVELLDQIGALGSLPKTTQMSLF